MSEVDDLLNKVKAEDARKRKEVEEVLLAKAHSLTNGSSDAKTQGEVLLGITTLLLSTHDMVRSTMDILPTLQTVAKCNQMRKTRGINWPTAIVILGAISTVLGIAARLGWI